MKKLIAALVVGSFAACGVESSAVLEDGVPQATETAQALTADAFPLRAGNSWTLVDGTTGATKTVRVVRSSGSVHLVEGLASSGGVWMAFAGQRLSVWNSTARAWQTFADFGSSESRSFSLGSPCEQFSSRRLLTNGTIETAAGSFTKVTSFEFIVTPPPFVRCAQPPFAAMSFSQNVGLVEVGTASQTAFRLTSASVGGRNYPLPSVKATLTMDRGTYQLDQFGAAQPKATLTLRNDTGRAVTYKFTSGQQFELQIKTASGNGVYFWSADKSFIATPTTMTLRAGETKTIVESLNVQFASAGPHVVTAWLPVAEGVGPEASTKVEFVGGVPPPCFIGGCSSQICSDREGVVSTCEFRPQYACYQSATCERQADGQCGWTSTPALTQCLARP